MPLPSLSNSPTQFWRFIPFIHALGAIIINCLFKYDHKDSDLSAVSGYFGPGAFWAWIITALLVLCQAEGRFYTSWPPPCAGEVSDSPQDSIEFDLAERRPHDDEWNLDAFCNVSRRAVGVLGLLIDKRVDYSGDPTILQRLAEDVMTETRDSCSHRCLAKKELARRILDHYSIRWSEAGGLIDKNPDEASYTPASEQIDSLLRVSNIWAEDFLGDLVHFASLHKHQDIQSISLDPGTCGVILYPLISNLSTVVARFHQPEWNAQDSAAADIAQIALAMSVVALNSHQSDRIAYHRPRRLAWIILFVSSFFTLLTHIGTHRPPSHGFSLLQLAYAFDQPKTIFPGSFLVVFLLGRLFQFLATRIWNTITTRPWPFRGMGGGVSKTKFNEWIGNITTSALPYGTNIYDHPWWQHSLRQKPFQNIFFEFALVFLAMVWHFCDSHLVPDYTESTSATSLCRLSFGVPVPRSSARISDLDQAAALATAVGAAFCQYVYGGVFWERVMRFLHSTWLSIHASLLR